MLQPRRGDARNSVRSIVRFALADAHEVAATRYVVNAMNLTMESRKKQTVIMQRPSSICKSEVMTRLLHKTNFLHHWGSIISTISLDSNLTRS